MVTSYYLYVDDNLIKVAAIGDTHGYPGCLAVCTHNNLKENKRKGRFKF